MKLLCEDHETLQNMERWLSSKIATARINKQLTPEMTIICKKYYDSIIRPWMDDTFLYNKILSEKEDKEMIDSMLDFYNIFNKYLKYRSTSHRK